MSVVTHAFKRLDSRVAFLIPISTFLHKNNHILLIMLYIDNLFITASSTTLILWIKTYFKKTLDMTNLEGYNIRSLHVPSQRDFSPSARLRHLHYPRILTTRPPCCKIYTPFELAACLCNKYTSHWFNMLFPICWEIDFSDYLTLRLVLCI